MLVCACSCANAHETAGAARTRLSLRPLFSQRDKDFGKPRAISAARRLVAVIRGQEDWRDWTVHVSDSDDEIFVLPFAFVLGKPH